MLVGWKLVGVLAAGEYVSLCVRRRGNVLSYRLGHATSSPAAPMFLFDDTIAAADLLPCLHTSTEVALLRVEARGEVRALEFCAGEEVDIVRFWAALRAGQSWPPQRSYRCWPHTLVASEIVPVALAWQGYAGGDRDALIARLAAGMEAARGVQVSPAAWFPVAAR